MSWEDDGYEIHRGLFNREICKNTADLIENMWKTADSCLEVFHPCDQKGIETSISKDGITTYKNLLQMTKEERDGKPVKINDLYLVSEKFREFLTNEKLITSIAEKLQSVPLLMSSLNVEFGTEQKMHVDSMFVTPPTIGKHVSVWIALESSHQDSGRFGYYPKSHKILPYIFQNGTRKIGGTINRAEGETTRKANVGVNEWDDWQNYMNLQLNGQSPVLFDAQIGDVIMWHGDLLHFGSHRLNKQITRKSAICFFHALNDYPEAKTVSFGKYHYFYKPPIMREA